MAAVDESGGRLYTAPINSPPDQVHSPGVGEGAVANGGWLVWQVIDSAFPVGGFAHSGGLEAAAQLGFVASPDDVMTFVRTALWQSAKLSTPFVIAAADSPGDFAGLNERFDVLTVNAVANAASRSQGAAVLSAGDAILRHPALTAARDALRQPGRFAHLPIAFAVLARCAGLTAAESADAFLYQQARSLMSAAVRLSLVGPMEAQRLLIGVADERAALLETALRTPVDAAAQTAPTLDLLQALHERLYSRLFVS